MTFDVLIDAMVRQTTMMIARLATSHGHRAPLSHITDQVFLDLARELQAAGLGRKVIADMFGLTLRAYHYRIRRLSENESDRTTTLWSAIAARIEASPMITRRQLLQQFGEERRPQVTSVLKDLVRSGIAFSTGHGARKRYRILEPSELVGMDDDNALTTLVLLIIYRQGPVTLSDLQQQTPRLSSEMLRSMTLKLEQQNKVRRTFKDGQEYFSADNFLVGLESTEGWEAAVFDHFQAVINTICRKAETRIRRAGLQDEVGGSTFCFELGAAHPLKDEVLLLFRNVRAQAQDLRQRVEAYSAAHPSEAALRVTFYVGQNTQLAKSVGD